MENVGKAGVNLGSAVIENMTGNGKDGVLEDFQGKLRNQELGLQSKRDEELKKSIEELVDNPEAAEAQLEKVANMAAQANGITDGDVDVEFYNAEDGNMGGHKNGKIYINLAYQDGSLEKMMEVMGDEMSHYVDYKNGRMYTEGRQNISTQYGDNTRDQTRGYIGNEQVDAQAFQDRLKDLDFGLSNQEVANTEGMAHRTRVLSRDVDMTLGLGKHLFIEIDPSNYDPNGKIRYISLDGKVLGGIAEVNTVTGFANDQKAIKEGKIRDSQVITVPKGMTEQQFDQTVIRNAEMFNPALPENRYPKLGGALNGQPNSNTFVDNVIEDSGGKIKNFKDAVNQNAGE